MIVALYLVIKCAYKPAVSTVLASIQTVVWPP